jgi:predicted DNA-binding helix-hairpin-helix protein
MTNHPYLRAGRHTQLMKPGHHECDEQVINAHMYLHDANEVLRVRLSDRNDEDILKVA